MHCVTVQSCAPRESIFHSVRALSGEIHKSCFYSRLEDAIAHEFRGLRASCRGIAPFLWWSAYSKRRPTGCGVRATLVCGVFAPHEPLQSTERPLIVLNERIGGRARA
jgi:hypothetical protein